MRKIIVYFLLIIACAFLLSGKDDYKYKAEFYITDRALKNFQNPTLATKDPNSYTIIIEQ